MHCGSRLGLRSALITAKMGGGHPGGKSPEGEGPVLLGLDLAVMRHEQGVPILCRNVPLRNAVTPPLEFLPELCGDSGGRPIASRCDENMMLG